MDKALELLTVAAQKVGVEAARVWPEMVRLHWVIALGGVVIWGVVMLTGALLLRAGIMSLRKQESDPEPGAWLILLLFGACVLIIGTVTGTIEGPNTIGALVAPEASLIRSMVGK